MTENSPLGDLLRGSVDMSSCQIGECPLHFLYSSVLQGCRAGSHLATGQPPFLAVLCIHVIFTPCFDTMVKTVVTTVFTIVFVHYQPLLLLILPYLFLLILLLFSPLCIWYFIDILQSSQYTPISVGSVVVSANS